MQLRSQKRKAEAIATSDAEPKRTKRRRQGTRCRIQAPAAYIHNLPPEILGQIFQRLPYEDLTLNVQLVCKRWNDHLDSKNKTKYVLLDRILFRDSPRGIAVTTTNADAKETKDKANDLSLSALGETQYTIHLALYKISYQGGESPYDVLQINPSPYPT